MRKIGRKLFHWTLVLGLMAGLLVSLLGPAGSAGAGTRAWSLVSIPSATGKVILNADIIAIAVSPNYANDSRVWAIVDGDADGTADDVARSTNGGRTWSIGDPNTTSVVELVGIAVSNQYVTDSTVVIADTTKVYRSTNGGTTWGQLGAAVGNTNGAAENDADVTDLRVTSVAIAPNYDGTGTIVVGTADDDNTDADFPTAAQSIQVWGQSGTLNWQDPNGAAASPAADVTAVAFSPSYGADATLFAVISSADGAPCLAAQNTCLTSLIGTTNAWDSGGGPTPLFDAVNIDAAAGGAEIVRAFIGLPTDLDTSSTTRRKLFVAANDAAALGGVYRVSAFSTTAVAAQLAGDVDSLSVAASIGDGGTVFAGMATNTVQRSANAFATTGVTYTGSTVVPGEAVANTVTAAAVVTRTAVATTPTFSTDSTVFAGNSLAAVAANQQTGFSVSANGGVNWAQWSLIDAAAVTTATTARITDISVLGTVIYMSMVDDDAGPNTDSLWRSTNSGTNWERVDMQNIGGGSPETALIAMSPDYATDGLLYWIDGGTAGARVRRTTNSGDSFGNTSAPAFVGMATSAVVTDTNTLIVGSSDPTVRRSINRGFIWSTSTATGAGGLISDLQRSPNFATDNTVVLGDGIGRVYRSTNGGSSFSRVGSVSMGAAAGDMSVAYDANYASNGTLYAAGSTSAEGIFRWVDGTSTTSWTNIDALAGSIFGGNPTTSGYANGRLLAGSDGVLYGANDLANSGVRRSTDPTARTGAKIDSASSPTFVSTNNSIATGARLGPIHAGSDVLYAVNTAANPDRIQTYTDTFANPQVIPTVTSPTNDAQVGTVAAGTATIGVGTMTFTWPAVTGASRYNIQVATSATFTGGGVAGENLVVSGVTTTNATTLTANVRYYWRIRGLYTGAVTVASADNITRFSDPQTFIAGAGAAGVAIPGLTTPVLGASGYTDTSGAPVFVWTAVTSATSYEIQVSTDGTFTDTAAIVIDRTGDTRLGNQLAYQDGTVTLQPATTYFWRVRAYISGTTVTGAYSPASAFRTVAGDAGGGVVAATALASLEAAGNLEMVTAFNYTSATSEAYVPGLPGNVLATIQPNSVITVTVTAVTTITVSGVQFTVQANTPTPLPVGSSVTITVTT